jgi:uncharacterized repeat protein (TIGR01451 family)
MTKRMWILSLLVCIVLGLPLDTAALAAGGMPQLLTAGPPEAVQPSPFLFVENRGQFGPGVRYVLRNGTGVTWFAQDAIWLTVWEAPPVIQPEHPAVEGSVPRPRGVNLKLSFVGANPQLRLEPFGRQATTVSYLLGGDRRWHPDVPAWAGVRYRDLYPGVDLVLGGTSGSSDRSMVPWHLEVRDGSALSAVRLRVEGADRVETAGERPLDGQISQASPGSAFSAWNRADQQPVPATGRPQALRLVTPLGPVLIPLPVVLNSTAQSLPQDRAGKGATVQQVGPRGFEVSSPFLFSLEDAQSSPRDDASDLVYSTFLGGSGWDWALDIAVDDVGAAYIGGATTSSAFTTTLGILSEEVAGQDAFVLKLSPDGSTLVYSVLVGGSSYEWGFGVALDGDRAVLSGLTASGDFTTTLGAYDRTCGTDGVCDGLEDAFVVELNPTGTSLDYATFVGGANLEAAEAVAVYGGDLYVTGSTRSADFPTTPGAYDRTCGTDGACDPYQGTPLYDAFLVQLHPTGSGTDDLTYGTFIGGQDSDYGYDVVCEGGHAFAVGRTSSLDFPGGGYNGGGDAFAVRLAPDGNGSGDLVYGMLIGGTSYDSANAVAVADGGAYVAGGTTSAGFPNPPTVCDILGDAFVAQVSPVGELEGAYCLGGTAADWGRGIALDAPGGLVLTGDTASTDFPTTPDGYDPSYNGGDDVFVARLELGQAEPLTYGTYLGGSDDEAGYAVAVDDLWHAFLTGYTRSSNDFPTTPGAYDETYNGGARDSYAAKLAVGQVPAMVIEKRTNGQGADGVPGPYILVGEPVTWTYAVTNTGAVVLSDVTVYDDQGGSVSCPTTTLALEASMICTDTGVATTGQYTNTAVVTATPPLGPQLWEVDTSHYYGARPNLSLQKQTNGEDADTAPGVYISVGQPVTWSYVVTNTGNVPLSNIILTDTESVTVTCPSATIAPSMTMVCTATGVAAAGQYSNTGIVIGTPPAPLETVRAEDLSHYYGSQPRIALEKLTNGERAEAAPGVYILVGEPVTWTYVVTNTGNVTLSDVAVSDDRGVVVTCPGATLAPSATMVCTATGMAVTGQYSNTGVVTGTPPVGAEATASDMSHYFGIFPSLLFEKHTNGEDADEPPGPVIVVGQPVTWTYHVTNTGNISLTAITVTDIPQGMVVCPTTTLGLEASMVCTATGSAEEGPYENIGMASGLAPEGTTVTVTDASHYYGFLPIPAITIQKRTNSEDADQPPGPYIPVGNEVLWTYDVANSGNVTLTQVVVTDSRLVTVNCPTTTLGLIEVMRCTANGIAEPGPYDNRGYASGTTMLRSAEMVTATDPSHYFGTGPGLALEKRTNGERAGEGPGPFIIVGEPVTWTYEVTNTGNVTLTGILVNDDQGVAVGCPTTTLGVEASMVCTATGVAHEGPYTNTGSAWTISPGGEWVMASDVSHYYGAILALEIEKHTNGQDADAPPGPNILVNKAVTWTYIVTSGSNVLLTDVVVTDTEGVEVDCPDATLVPSATMVCTATGLAVKGPYANTGVVTATPPGGLEAVSSVDDSHYFGVSPSLVLVKHTNGQDADAAPGVYVVAGEPVTWTYAVTNTGNVALTEVMVSDDQGPVVTCPSTTLVPSATMVCTATGVAATGQYTNGGWVEGLPSLGGVVTDTDMSHYYGAVLDLSLQKSTNGEDADTEPGPQLLVGEQVTWTYQVTNDGNVALSSVVVTDNKEAVVTCPDDTLPAGVSMVCTATGVVEAGQYGNRAVVRGAPPGGLAWVWAADESHYYGVRSVRYVYLPIVLREAQGP